MLSRLKNVWPYCFSQSKKYFRHIRPLRKVNLSAPYSLLFLCKKYHKRERELCWSRWHVTLLLRRVQAKIGGFLAQATISLAHSRSLAPMHGRHGSGSTSNTRGRQPACLPQEGFYRAEAESVWILLRANLGLCDLHFIAMPLLSLAGVFRGLTSICSYGFSCLLQ